MAKIGHNSVSIDILVAPHVGITDEANRRSRHDKTNGDETDERTNEPKTEIDRT